MTADFVNLCLNCPESGNGKARVAAKKRLTSDLWSAFFENLENKLPRSKLTGY